MKRLLMTVVALVGCFILSISVGGAVFAASFEGLGDLPGGSFESFGRDISADGSVVGGISSSGESGSHDEAFRWTPSEGMVGLGDLPGGLFRSFVWGVSADGSAIVGGSSSAASYASGTYNYETFLWTPSEGMVGLGDLPGGSVNSWAQDVSSDGSVVVGYGNIGPNSSNIEAFRWTAGGGMAGLGFLPGHTYSFARAVSSDGSVVVGASQYEAFRWTAGGGMVGLGFLAGDNASRATGVSADGSVVVGYSQGSGGIQAILWTQAGGMVGLGFVPGHGSSRAYGVSADGSVVVGVGDTGLGDGTFIWDATNGMRSIKDVLTNEFGLNLSEWTLEEAFAISDDGLTIVGTGTNPSGDTEAVSYTHLTLPTN